MHIAISATAVPPVWAGVIFIKQGALDPAPPGSAAVDPNRPPCEPRVPIVPVSAGSLIQSTEHANHNEPKYTLNLVMGPV